MMNCLVVALAVASCVIYSPASAYQLNRYVGRSRQSLSMTATEKPPVVVGLSGVTRNENFAKLQAGYLFPEIGRRRNEYLARNPDAKLISLGRTYTLSNLQSSLAFLKMLKSINYHSLRF